MKATSNKDEEYHKVNMSKKEMLQVLTLLYGKEAPYEVLENYAKNMGGLAYHLIECYRNAGGE